MGIAVIVVALVVIPVLWNVVLAFQNLSLIDIRDAGLFQSFSLQNFVDVFTGSGFWYSILNTVIYSVFSTAGSILLGLGAALALRKPFRGRAPIDFLGRSPSAMVTVILFETWRYFPFAFLSLTARLVAIPTDLEEAAVVDGAGIWQRFRFVVLPQLYSVIALLSVLRLVMTFNKFDDVYLLTGGGAGTEVAAVRVYDTLTGRFDVGGAAAQSLVLAAFLAVSLTVYLHFLRRTEEPR